MKQRLIRKSHTPYKIAALIALSALPATAFAQSTPAPQAPINLGASLPSTSNAATTTDASPATLTLAQAIDMTLKASTQLDVATRNLDRDEARIQQAKALGGVKIGASANATHYDGPTVIKFGASAITALPQDTQLLGVNASLPIDLSGQIKAQTDVQRLQALADKFTRDTIYNQLVFNAQSAYFGLLRAKHQVQVAEAAVANAQAQQTLASQQYQAGTGQRIDLLRANTQVATAQQALTQAKNGLGIALIAFNDTTGRPLNAQTDAVDVPGVTAGFATSANVSKPVYFKAPITEVNAIDVEKSVATATNARPELRQDLVNIQATEKSIKLAKSGLEPELILNAGGNYNPTTSFSAPRQRVAEIGATLNIPLFDSGLTRAKVREANDNAANAKALYGSHTTDVGMQVRQSYLNLLTAAQQIDSANVALQQAVAARQLAQTRYQGGVGLYLEITDSESALTSAETNQVNAVYNYLTARAQYENALGTPNLTPTLPTVTEDLSTTEPAVPPTLPGDVHLAPGGNPAGPVGGQPLAPDTKGAGDIHILPGGSPNGPVGGQTLTTDASPSGDVHLLPGGSPNGPVGGQPLTPTPAPPRMYPGGVPGGPPHRRVNPPAPSATPLAKPKAQPKVDKSKKKAAPKSDTPTTATTNETKNL
jgi:outer membrane protein